jgi:hypothetical protein
MSDYATPTVVIPLIPEACMTPVERFILTSIFQHERIVEKQSLYIYAQTGIDDEVFVSRAACEAVLDQAEPGTDRLAMLLAHDLRRPSQRHDPKPLVSFINALDPLRVLQGIVRRHADRLPWIIIQQAFTCTRMRPDGFGGMGTVIHVGGIEHICTTSWASQRVLALQGISSAASFQHDEGRE